MVEYDGREIANFILDYCDSRDRPVTNLSLQKIVYFCHVWSLINLGRPLVRHKFEAWEFGPVLPYLYREFKTFDRSPITSRATRIDQISGKMAVVEYRIDSQTEAFLQRITDFYSRLRSSELVKLTHAAGGPWHKVWNHREMVNPGMRIDDSEILRFYSKVPRPFSIQ
jgi:uncharacterized phage-associated protein